ncbi:MAG: hypothetical protein DHS20C18_08310 [Saprospiraceae bacterium]|nr:MAG: hypothetical protein DHS20C18_08310 [Saprospiraceae bacterium]
MNNRDRNLVGKIGLILIALLSSSILFAQGWERIYPGNANAPSGYDASLGYEVFVEDNGGYLIYCEFDGEHRFMWTDQNGYQTNAMALPTEGQAMIKNADGDYVFANRIFTPSPEEDVALVKIDPNGTLIWEHHFGQDFGNEAVTALLQSSDGNYLFAGGGFDLDPYGYVYKTNENGDVLWKMTTRDFHFDTYEFSLIETADGGYLMSGSTPIFSAGNVETELLKLDINGNVQWTNELLSELKIRKTLIDGNTFLFWGYSTTGVNLIKTDDSGNELWNRSWGLGDASDLIRTEDGGYALLYNTIEGNIALIKTDSDGNTQWQEEYGGTYTDRGNDLKQTADGGFIITGSANGFNESVSMYLIKTDANGIALTNVIEGYVHYDLNENCTIDPGEPALEDWIVSAEGPSSIFYGSVNEDGYYHIEANTGTYDVSVRLPNAYWDACDGIETVQLDNDFDTTQVNFEVQSIEQCPLMEVSMYSGGLRICDQNQITVMCKNQGTMLAEDVYVEITFADSLTLVGATVPYILISGNTYSFEVGDINFLQQQDFSVDVMVGCAEELLGQSLCSEALIFPDTSCLPIDPLWSGASIELSAWCEEGEVKLQIKNVGNADMTEALEYFVVEDDVIMNHEPFGPLEVDGVFQLTREANGTFYRIQSQQEPFHPGNSMPSAFVEACGENGNGESSLGFVNQFPLDDANANIDILCVEVVGSYDPNIKVAFPEGYDTPHFIAQNTEIEYVIHFQNTGTAMANLVVVQDALSPHLDPASIRLGSSSHAYDFELFGNGILKFTFKDIMLPDSTTDEAASHGFVQFKIAQQKDLPIGTQIHNEAAIYFDHNTPIITNKTLHTIGEDFITVGIGPVSRADMSVQVYPNPFEVSAIFEVKGTHPGDLNFQLFDTMGRRVRKEQFSGNIYEFYRYGLPAGVFFYTISDEQGLLNSGKLMMQ